MGKDITGFDKFTHRIYLKLRLLSACEDTTWVSTTYLVRRIEDVPLREARAQFIQLQVALWRLREAGLIKSRRLTRADQIIVVWTPDLGDFDD